MSWHWQNSFHTTILYLISFREKCRDRSLPNIPISSCTNQSSPDLFFTDFYMTFKMWLRYGSCTGRLLRIFFIFTDFHMTFKMWLWYGLCTSRLLRQKILICWCWIFLLLFPNHRFVKLLRMIHRISHDLLKMWLWYGEKCQDNPNPDWSLATIKLKQYY